MRKLLLIAALAVCANAQYVTVSATNLQDANGSKANGTVTFVPHANFKLTGQGQVTLRPIVATVVNGFFTTSLADTRQATPGICYTVYAQDSLHRVFLGDPSPNVATGYQCVQTSNAWCVSGTCNFDTYVPDTTAQFSSAVSSYTQYANDSTDGIVSHTNYTLWNSKLSGVPAPTGTSLGGIKTFSCTTGYHVSSVDSNGVVACTIDTGSGGGGGSGNAVQIQGVPVDSAPFNDQSIFYYDDASTAIKSKVLPQLVSGDGTVIEYAPNTDTISTIWTVDSTCKTGSSCTIPTNVCHGYELFNPSGNYTAYVPQAALNGTFRQGCTIRMINYGAFPVTLTATGTVPHKTIGGQATMQVPAGTAAVPGVIEMFSDGADWQISDTPNSSGGGGGGVSTSGNATALAGYNLASPPFADQSYFYYDNPSTTVKTRTLPQLVAGDGTTIDYGTSSDTLNTIWKVDSTTCASGSTCVVPSTDCHGILSFNSAGSYTASLPQAGINSAFRSGCAIKFVNYGAGTVTVAPTGTAPHNTIGGAANLAIAGGSATQPTSYMLYSNGTDWLISEVPGGGGSGGSFSGTRTWSFGTMGTCQNAVAGAGLWFPTSNAPAFTVCDATHQQGEWIVPASTTAVNWGLNFVIPAGTTGAYTMNLIWRTADTTTSHSVVYTPSYSCVAAGSNPDNPTYTSMSTFTTNASAVASTNIASNYTFTPTCAASAQFRLKLTVTSNTITQPVQISYQNVTLTANN